MRRLSLPPARPLLRPLRGPDTARTSIDHLPRHRRRITIDHQPLDGITPAMLAWWFRHIGDPVTYAGTSMSGYLAWHPLDHIRWELARPAPTGGAGEGARFRIVEAFGRKPEFYVDTTDRVEKLDDTGIRLVRRALGVPILRLEHTWSHCGDRTHYVSVMDIGTRSTLMTPVNRLLTRRFPDEMVEAWVVHNIEEVGYLEQLLPDLCGAQGIAVPATTV
jgi:hypothetical protein